MTKLRVLTASATTSCLWGMALGGAANITSSYRSWVLKTLETGDHSASVAELKRACLEHHTTISSQAVASGASAIDKAITS